MDLSERIEQLLAYGMPEGEAFTFIKDVYLQGVRSLPYRSEILADVQVNIVPKGVPDQGSEAA